MKSIIYLFFLLMLTNVYTQDNVTWVKTNGVIKELEKKRRGKTFATVSFTTKDGKEASAYIQLLGLPIIGSFKSVGDSIEVYYDKTNPAIAKSESGKFLSQYGIIILIALGVFFSVKRYLNVVKLHKTA
ncbi:DUF3592 domain-containing protein [Tenacibaculum jejuense]|uniref:DUF3592 domain-containing protein n=1 Tax=Tenacibaculum jejuense TaxID=584609 RepID=A0A238UAP3_9FLAO|nr:DUF3592 domain-containing protein [Tenacibaculum jejuense]SNR16267.1 protein of unknown function [Tenacibaculum jejuense]